MQGDAADLATLARGGSLSFVGSAAGALLSMGLVFVISWGLGADDGGAFFEAIALLQHRDHHGHPRRGHRAVAVHGPLSRDRRPHGTRPAAGRRPRTGLRHGRDRRSHRDGPCAVDRNVARGREPRRRDSGDGARARRVRPHWRAQPGRVGRHQGLRNDAAHRCGRAGRPAPPPTRARGRSDHRRVERDMARPWLGSRCRRVAGTRRRLAASALASSRPAGGS